MQTSTKAERHSHADGMFSVVGLKYALLWNDGGGLYFNILNSTQLPVSKRGSLI